MRVSTTPAAEQLSVLTSGTAEVITEEELFEKLKRAQQRDVPLRVKLGMDPSAPDVHLGHAVPLRKLRQFQSFGHEVYLVIGDFTGRIGDPSGKSETRSQLSEEQVRGNARTYEQQVFKILLPELTHIVFNNDWLGQLRFGDVVRLGATYTVARMLERDEFAARYREGRPIHVHEFMYPLAQAYDSIHLSVDVELGGTDQTFNFVAARDIMRAYGVDAQVALTVPLLVGTDGVEKMSKSLGNYIGVTDSPDEIYGRTMSIPDSLLVGYFSLAAGAPPERVAGVAAALERGTTNPRDLKMELAREIVALYHDPEAARSAEEGFKRVFQRGEIPEGAVEVELDPAERHEGRVWSVKLLLAAGLAPSASEAKRLLAQGAVRLDGERIGPDQDLEVADGAVLQVGRRRFARLRWRR